MEIRLVNDLDNSVSTEATRSFYGNANGNNAEAGPHLDVENLIRKYWLLLVVLAVVGAAGGFATVVLSSPVYKARLVLEVQSVNESFLKNSIGCISVQANEGNHKTQINILKAG